MTYYNLVLSGGAFKSCAFIGCIKYLEEIKAVTTIKNVIGSSAGGIIALMYCVGVSTNEMRDLMVKGMHDYLDKDIDVEAVFDIFDTMGLDDASIFTSMMRDLLSKTFNDPDINFRDFSKATGKNFVVTGSNVSLAKVEYFSIDTTPEMSVVDAVRISISLPFVMKPVVYKECIYVDGSIFNNFPIEYFQTPGKPFQDTIALLLGCPFTPPKVTDLNLFKFTRILIDAMFMRVNEKISNVGKNNQVINMEFPDDNYGFDLGTFKLIMNDTKLEEYIAYGYKSIKKQITVSPH